MNISRGAGVWLALLALAVAPAAHAGPWIMHYDGAGKRDVWIGLAALDSNAVIAYGSSDGANGSDIVSVRYGGSGNVLWTRSFDGAAHKHDRAFAGTLNSSGNLVIVGSTGIGAMNEDGLALCRAPNGDLLWQYTMSGNGGAPDVLECVVPGPAASVYVAGSRYQVATEFDWFVGRLSSVGAEMWAVTTDIAGTVSHDNVTALATTATGVVAAGIVGDPEGRGTLGVRGYSDAGALLWTYAYAPAGGFTAWPRDVAVAADGSIYVCGLQGSADGTDWLLIKLSSAGAYLWTQTWDGGNGWDQAVDAEATGDSVTVLGVVAESETTFVMRVARHSPAGPVVWSRQLGSGLGGHNDPRNALVTADGGVYVGGTYTTGDSTNSMAVIQLAANGDQTALWTVEAGPSGPAAANDIGLANGALFMAGVAAVPAGSTDAMLARLGSAGAIVLESQTGTPRTFSARMLGSMPARGRLQLEVQLSARSDLEALLLDTAGRVRMRRWLGLGLEPGTHRMSLPVEDVAPGIYFLKVSGRSGAIPLWWHHKIVLLD